MTVDSSALLAILFGEANHLDLVDRILETEIVRMGAPTLAESAVVLGARRRTNSERDLAALVEELGITIVPFTADHWPVALSAFIRFGRGRHKAALNFGDCLSYAVARLADDSLLFVGDDFTRTDIRPALA